MQVAFTRYMFIVAIFGLWMLVISARLVHLQVTQHEWLLDKAVDQRQDVKSSKLLRGTIYDRDQRPLAISLKVKTLYADSLEIADVKAAATVIAKAVDLNVGTLTKQLTEAKAARKRFVPLLQKVDSETVQKLNKLLETDNVRKGDLPKFEGLHWSDDQTRNYPYGSMASQVIGFSDIDGKGMAGIEQSQNDLLYGSTLKKRQERDRLGRIYDETVSETTPPADVTLTIAASLQSKTEQALENGVKNANARSGVAIAISPKTGEILALANYPSFDPNSVSSSAVENIKNYAIQSVYSPGSVMKLVTYSSALEKNLFEPDDMIDAGNGTIEVAKHKFSDSHHVGAVTYTQALAHSSNVCAIKTGLRVGKADFFSTLTKMGFGSKTGVELPAETNGIVRSPEKWNGDSLASMSIGYEIGVTALQMATAFATIANNGIKVNPHVIKQTKRENEAAIITAVKAGVVVVSPDSARKLRTMLRQVVLTGTGKRAQLNGYTSAGKTGTAWKFDPVAKRVDSGKYISSFIGYAPAENPEVVIAVVIDEPRAGGTDGGTVAAPVFREIAEQILPELGIKPDSKITKGSEPALIDVPESPGLVAEDDRDKSERADPASAARTPAPARPTFNKSDELKKKTDKKDRPEKKQGNDTTAMLEVRERNKLNARSLKT